jgi:hypothetical protein
LFGYRFTVPARKPFWYRIRSLVIVHVAPRTQ